MNATTKISVNIYIVKCLMIIMIMIRCGAVDGGAVALVLTGKSATGLKFTANVRTCLALQTLFVSIVADTTRFDLINTVIRFSNR